MNRHRLFRRHATTTALMPVPMLILMSFYGLFAHTLYRSYWLLIPALQAVTLSLVERGSLTQPESRVRRPAGLRPAAGRRSEA